MLLTNAKLAAIQDDGSLGTIDAGAIIVDGETIEWVGSMKQLPDSARDLEAINLAGRWVTPGLIDCHTHIVHGGNRANEFEMRLNGKSYEEVARSGGGILATVSATRSATVNELITSALPRVDALIAEGVTTLEIKSGYGLDLQTELNMLRAARAIESKRDVRIKTTFLGAHAIPPEFSGRADAYLDTVCLPALRAAHAEKLVDAVDGFCERIAFLPAQIERVFYVAQELNLPIKLHAEQLSNSGGVQLAAGMGALSVDHLEYANERDVTAMAKNDCVAVLLPGAFYALREKQLPPIELLRQQGVPIAVATDCNPGSSPLTSILLAMNMACTLFRLTPAEALAGVTRHAAAALSLADCGQLRAGLRADLAIWNIDHPAELAYRIGFNPLYRRVFAGRFEEGVSA